VAALRACVLELVQLRALLFFQLRELLILGSQLPVEFREALQVVLDELDPPGACAKRRYSTTARRSPGSCAPLTSSAARSPSSCS